MKENEPMIETKRDKIERTRALNAVIRLEKKHAKLVDTVDDLNERLAIAKGKRNDAHMKLAIGRDRVAQTLRFCNDCDRSLALTGDAWCVVVNGESVRGKHRCDACHIKARNERIAGTFEAVLSAV